MSTSRRDFLKTTIIAGAGAVLPPVPALAASTDTPQESDANAAHAPDATEGYTRGLGLYPGAPEANFSPDLIIDNSTYRNLALLRPAYHSSSYDYNLTAQLVTDGIKDTQLPQWVAVSLPPYRSLADNERELLLDHYGTNAMEIFGGRPQSDSTRWRRHLPVIDRLAVCRCAPPCRFDG